MTIAEDIAAIERVAAMVAKTQPIWGGQLQRVAEAAKRSEPESRPAALPAAGPVEHALDPAGQGLPCPTCGSRVPLQALRGQPQLVPLGFPVVDGGTAPRALGRLFHGPNYARTNNR
jgi:hypothetical protein